MFSARIDRLERAKETWRRRYALLSGNASREEVLTWREEAESTVSELERERRLESARLAELRTSRAALQTKLSRAGATGGPKVPWLREQDGHLSRLIDGYETDLATLKTAAQLHRWHLAEVKDEVARPSLLERLDDAGESIVSLWQYRLTTIEGHPITAGKLFGSLLLFLLGFIISRFLSKALGRRVLPRFGMHTGGRRAVETLTFYFLIVFFGLFALRMVNVPLTVFTVLGGALAIGVGFGSQNIVNNFISGLILLIEQPIKADDLIEVDGTYGVVERIGARSTRVRTFSNIHIIVPNSSFLEKNVINWTLSDNLVRVEVHVGVAYGSPTRRVDALIRQALGEHKEIETYPAPIVYFADFGDNALLFEAVFWIRITTQADRRRIQSDVRFRIDELFREADVVIAFPQRDVHLDTLAPLEVKVVRDSDGPPDNG
jgi:small-conductance mechanosensitive channel